MSMNEKYISRRGAWHQIYTKEEAKITSPEEVGEGIAYHS